MLIRCFGGPGILQVNRTPKSIITNEREMQTQLQHMIRDLPSICEHKLTVDKSWALASYRNENFDPRQGILK